jgi:type I restriction enzyme S subunit
MGRGFTVVHMYASQLKQLVLALPPVEEQAAIVRVLDYVDRRIRRYVGAKQTLIRLLEEQKQAVIHRAVTRGLDPNVRLLPSGVNWLGEVPAHWEVTRLKAHLSRNDSGAWGSDFADDGTIVLRSTEQTVDGGWRINSPARRVLSDRERNATLLREGDLVVTKSSGSAAHIGKTSLVDAEIERLSCGFSNFMQRLRPTPSADPQFLWYCLNGSLGREQMVYFSSTTTGLGNLSGTILGNLWLAFPPINEQRAICHAVTARTRSAQRAIDSTHDEIGLLRELRTRLIASVVTGKLDVREAAARLQDATERSDALEETESEAEVDDGDEGTADEVLEEADA